MQTPLKQQDSKVWSWAMLAVTMLVLTIFSLAYAATGTRLILNGKVASTNVRTIGGAGYVKIEDVARALGMVAVKRADGYEIKKAGGATPVKGLQGKVGDVLFDGRWRFQVPGVQTVNSYTMKTNADVDYSVYRDIAQYDVTTRVFTPLKGYKLVAIPCRLTNAHNAKRALWINPPETHTALADMNGESHPPIAYDVSGAPYQTKELLPGAKIDMTLLFAVPQATQLKDLVFTLRGTSSVDAYAQKPHSDVRVSLGGA